MRKMPNLNAENAEYADRWYAENAEIFTYAENAEIMRYVIWYAENADLRHMRKMRNAEICGICGKVK